MARTATAVLERLDRRLEAMESGVAGALCLIILEIGAMLYVTIRGFHWP